MSAIYLDIETLDFFSDEHIAAAPREVQILLMRFGLAVTIDDMGDARYWREDEGAACWEHIHNYEQIVGYNILAFDLPILYREANKALWLRPRFGSRSIIDLFHEIRDATGRWYKLEELAQANLGRGKSADGRQAALWLRSKSNELQVRAADYCREDVQIVIDLYAICTTGAPLILPPMIGKGAAEARPMRIWISANGWERYEVLRSTR